MFGILGGCLLLIVVLNCWLGCLGLCWFGCLGCGFDFEVEFWFWLGFYCGLFLTLGLRICGLGWFVIICVLLLV